MTFKDFLKVYRGEFDLVADGEETSCTVCWDEYRLTEDGETEFQAILSSNVTWIGTPNGYGCIELDASESEGEKFSMCQAGYCGIEFYDRCFNDD